MSQELLPLPEHFCATMPASKGLGEETDELNIYVECGTLLFSEEQMRAYALANLQAAKPADTLGSLPVVAEIVVESCDEPGVTDDSYDFNVQQDAQMLGYGKHPLTLHAQATEALAKKEAFWKRVVNVADAQTNQYIEKCKALEAKLAGVDGLIRQARLALESCDHGHISDGGNQWYDEALVEPAIAALATYEAARREK